MNREIKAAYAEARRLAGAAEAEIGGLVRALERARDLGHVENTVVDVWALDNAEKALALIKEIPERIKDAKKGVWVRV